MLRIRLFKLVLRIAGVFFLVKGKIRILKTAQASVKQLSNLRPIRIQISAFPFLFNSIVEIPSRECEGTNKSKY